MEILKRPVALVFIVSMALTLIFITALHWRVVLKEVGMPIVTISRGSYSRGRKVAEALARELGYECLSRDILVESSEQFNIPEIKLVKALHDAPSVLDRFHHGQERFRNYFKSSFLTQMAKGNIVYHGLAGHFFLQNISHVLKVRINAKMSCRVEEEAKREGCSKASALYRLKKDDEERRRWSLQLYGKDTWDSRLYDMVFCVDSLTVDDIVGILVTTIKKKQFQETAESIAALNKRALLAKIYALVTPVSPMAKVTLINGSSVEIANINGCLKTDRATRQRVANIIKDEFGFETVLYREPVETDRGHINTFYNIDTM